MEALANNDTNDIKILNLKNRFYSDDADLAGYRDMNYAIFFNGVICELQITLRVSHNRSGVPFDTRRDFDDHYV